MSSAVAGDWAVRGVIPLFVTVSTVLAFALIRVSSLAHEGLHAVQLSATQKITGSDANGASQSVRRRRPTRVVLGSSTHDSSSDGSCDSDSGRVSSGPQGRESARGSKGSRGGRRGPGSVTPLPLNMTSGTGGILLTPNASSSTGMDALREWEHNVLGKSASGLQGETTVPGSGGVASGGEADADEHIGGAPRGGEKEAEEGKTRGEGTCEGVAHRPRAFLPVGM